MTYYSRARPFSLRGSGDDTRGLVAGESNGAQRARSSVLAPSHAPVKLFEEGVGQQKLVAAGLVAVDAVGGKVAEKRVVNLHLQRRAKHKATAAVLVVDDEIAEHELRGKGRGVGG